MAEFTNDDRIALRKIQRKAGKIDPDGEKLNKPDIEARDEVIELAGEVLARHELPDNPSWSIGQRVNARANWLRCGRTQSEIARGKYSLSNAFAVLSAEDQEALIAAHRAEDNTHFVYSIQDGPSRWWDLPRPFMLSPNQALRVAQRLVDEGFIPVPQLFSQKMLHDRTLDELEAWSRPYADLLADWTGFVWATFEHDEAHCIPPRSYKESLRGDDWITALMGRLERQWGVPVACHMRAGEFHYYTKWAEGGKAGEEPPKMPILLFQCNSWEPDPLAQAHDGDWRYVLTRCNAETGGRQVVLPWEYCQLEPSWADEDVREVGAHLSNVSPVYDQPRAYGNGGE